MLSTPRLALVLAAVSLGCSPTTSSGGTTPPADNNAAAGSGSTIGGAPADPAGPAENGAEGTGPAGQEGAATGVVAGSPNDNRFISAEISHSKGVPGGVVVLFPRIIPSASAAENQALAQSVQQKMKQLVEKALPGRPIDVRPSPERVCPRSGCDGMSIGVLFNRSNTACMAVALVNGPGASQIKMVPWAGTVTLKADPIQFRDQPENYVTIKDFVKCDDLVNEMGKQDAFVEAAVRAAADAAPVAAPATAPAAPAPAPATTPAVTAPATSGK